MALNARQHAFVLSYLLNKNATQAAKDAGYSQHTAQEQGSKLLSNVMVSQAIQSAQEAAAKKVGITIERVANRIADIAFDQNEKNKFVTLKACELLGKYLKMFTDKLIVEDETGFADKLKKLKSSKRNNSDELKKSQDDKEST